jgi:protein-tyrosine phosphatase
MNTMIDLHCHYLPGVDDGAPDMPAALNLARAAVANGIKTAVLTPHLYPGRWNNLRTVLEPVFEQFKDALESQDIALEVKLGAEVHLLPDSLALLDTDEIPFLGKHKGSKVMLLEFPDGQIPVGAMMAVKYFLKRGVTPMIAHPERNKDVMRNLQKIVPFVQEGCLLQLTAASVCGRFGNSALEAALRILDAGLAHVVATDSHNLAHRPPILAEAKAALAARYGIEAAIRLTDFNPGEIAAEHARA